MGILLCGLALPGVLGAQGRRPAPVIREADFSSVAYLSLDDLAPAVKGTLHPYPVSQRTDLLFPSHEIQFSIGTDKALVDGQPAVLEAPSLENDRGVWVVKSFFQSGPLASEFHKHIDLGPIEKAETAKLGAGETEKQQTVVAPSPRVPVSPVPAVKPAAAAEVKTSPVAEAEEDEEENAPAEHPPAPHVIRRIVIDPGHGGKDPGAVGVKGTEEKAMNLWMGLELADALREKDFEVLLTRTDDTFIPLAQRAALANRYKADLFISIHCNASLSPKLSGFEVYILSEKASDPHAAAVARLENASLEFEGKAPPEPVQAVLRSLAKNANINRSAQLASIMDRKIGEQMAEPDAGLQQAAFYVLRGAEMPAILIELGFLSNKDEEQHLQNKKYRKKMIHAIEDSILEFDQKQKK